jgi:hypothetical protein
MLKCFFGFHEWSRWAPVTLSFMNRFNPADRWTQDGQRRACARCGFIQEREV